MFVCEFGEVPAVGVFATVPGEFGSLFVLDFEYDGEEGCLVFVDGFVVVVCATVGGTVSVWCVCAVCVFGYVVDVVGGCHVSSPRGFLVCVGLVLVLLCFYCSGCWVCVQVG